MLQLINLIPDSIGWMLVGMVVMLDLVMIKVLVGYWIDYRKAVKEAEKRHARMSAEDDDFEEIILDTTWEECYN